MDDLIIDRNAGDGGKPYPGAFSLVVYLSPVSEKGGFDSREAEERRGDGVDFNRRDSRLDDMRQGLKNVLEWTLHLFSSSLLRRRTRPEYQYSSTPKLRVLYVEPRFDRWSSFHN